MNLRTLTAVSLLLLVGCVSNQHLELRDTPEVHNQYSIGKAEYRPKQLYPRSMFEKQQNGWVLLKVDIDSEGNTKNIEVLDFSPSMDFVPNAVNYVDKTKYRKYTEGDRPKEIKGHQLLVKYELRSNA